MNAQKPTGPIYLAPEVTTADSIAIDLLWNELKRAVLNTDEAKVKSICADGFSFTDNTKPDVESGTLFYSDSEVLSILKSVFDDRAFRPVNNQYHKSITSLAAAQPDISPDADSEEYHSVSFALHFTASPSLITESAIRGWYFLFYRSESKTVLWGVYKF